MSKIFFSRCNYFCFELCERSSWFGCLKSCKRERTAPVGSEWWLKLWLMRENWGKKHTADSSSENCRNSSIVLCALNIWCSSKQAVGHSKNWFVSKQKKNDKFFTKLTFATQFMAGKFQVSLFVGPVEVRLISISRHSPRRQERWQESTFISGRTGDTTLHFRRRASETRT